MTQAFPNLIKIPLTTDMVGYWGNSSIAPLIDNNYLNLRIHRKDYAKIEKGKGVNLNRGYKGFHKDGERKTLGFRVNIRYQREDLYIALVELANYTAGKCELNPIEVIDYHYCHDRTDRERGYRIRRGVFEGNFAQVKGTVTTGQINCDGQESSGGDRYSSGFSFKFMEVSPVGYF